MSGIQSESFLLPSILTIFFFFSEHDEFHLPKQSVLMRSGIEYDYLFVKPDF